MITVGQMDHPVYVQNKLSHYNRRRKLSTVNMCL